MRIIKDAQVKDKFVVMWEHSPASFEIETGPGLVPTIFVSSRDQADREFETVKEELKKILAVA